MTNIKTNNMLEITGANFIALDKITLDERAPEEIRRDTFLASNKKFKKSPMQAINPEVELKSQEIITDSRSKSTE